MRFSLATLAASRAPKNTGKQHRVLCQCGAPSALPAMATCLAGTAPPHPRLPHHCPPNPAAPDAIADAKLQQAPPTKSTAAAAADSVWSIRAHPTLCPPPAAAAAPVEAEEPAADDCGSASAAAADDDSTVVLDWAADCDLELTAEEVSSGRRRVGGWVGGWVGGRVGVMAACNGGQSTPLLATLCCLHLQPPQYDLIFRLPPPPPSPSATLQAQCLINPCAATAGDTSKPSSPRLLLRRAATGVRSACRRLARTASGSGRRLHASLAAPSYLSRPATTTAAPEAASSPQFITGSH